MEKRIHIYVNPKHIGVWLMVLCMASSAICRILLGCEDSGTAVWWQVVLPVAGVWLYALNTVVSGREMFYKTALPVWLLGISKAGAMYPIMQNSPLLFGMVCICIVFFCAAYTLIAGGRIRCPWMLLPLYLLALSAMGYEYLYKDAGYRLLPDALMMLGMLLLLFALKVHTDGNYHPTWGDRVDGRRIRSVPALDQVASYIMVDRNGANNLFSESVEISETERYIRRKRREGLTGFGLTHVIIAAYVRTVAKYPALNRFISGQKLYSHGEDISLCMTVKKELSASAPDTVIKAHLHPGDTAEDVYRKFNAQVEEAKNTPLDSGVDNTAGILALIPGIVLKFVFWLLRFLDYFGLVPRFLLEISPFHGSAYFTSMGSLGIRPVYHHLYDFGNIPVFCSFGRKRRAEELEGGQAVVRKYVDLRFNLDERICDGYYYASLIKYFMRLVANPDVLDTPPEKIMQDIP